mgnify:CR=1 FL=1|jgi:hypothetical protein
MKCYDKYNCNQGRNCPMRKQSMHKAVSAVGSLTMFILLLLAIVYMLRSL